MKAMGLNSFYFLKSFLLYYTMQGLYAMTLLLSLKTSALRQIFVVNRVLTTIFPKYFFSIILSSLLYNVQEDFMIQLECGTTCIVSKYALFPPLFVSYRLHFLIANSHRVTFWQITILANNRNLFFATIAKFYSLLFFSMLPQIRQLYINQLL